MTLEMEGFKSLRLNCCVSVLIKTQVSFQDPAVHENTVLLVMMMRGIGIILVIGKRVLLRLDFHPLHRVRIGGEDLVLSFHTPI